MAGQLTLLCLLFAFGVSSAVDDWSYEGANGPYHWADTLSYTHCDDDHQSPIDIHSHDAHEEHFEEFHFENYDHTDGITLTVHNNGHSVVLSESGAEMHLTGGDLPHEYTFDSLHFHWGRDDTQGSEHTIDDHHYPMEMHMVHHSSEYTTLTEAKDHEEGLAVLAFFFQVQDDDNQDLDTLIEALDHVDDYDASYDLPTTFALEDLYHGHIDDYFRYSGSLTTPGCEEVVVWTVFEDPIPISHAQLDHFRELLDSDSEHIWDNYRPVQELHERVVHHYHNDHGNHAATAATHALLLAATALLAMLAAI